MRDKNFVVYKSSAGSGKTFTLVKEYLSLALADSQYPPQNYKHILAITFTRKAAAEMKERISFVLKELSEDDYTNISAGTKTLLALLKQHPQIMASSKEVDDALIRKRAKLVLTAILHNYSDFAISTIDSFVHKVVRTFAFDLKIPMSFEIETDDKQILSKAIDLLLAQIGNDEDLTKVLVDYMESQADNEKSWHIENKLKEIAKQLLTEEGDLYIAKLKHLKVSGFFKIKNQLYKVQNHFETTIQAHAKRAVQLIQKNGLTAKDFYQGAKGIVSYFERLAAGSMDKIALNNKFVIETVGEDKWYSAKIGRDEKQAIDAIKSNLLDDFNQIQIEKENNYPEYILCKLIAKNIYSLAVLNEIEKLLHNYKSQNNILHISEFNKLVATIVLNEPVPFVYERLGEKYTNYLIDEFQDTSILQFQNLLPLLDNAIAGGNFNMLVGDGKQAIYRWRGGEAEQFVMLPQVYSYQNNLIVKEREAALIRNYEEKVLAKNFRSKKEVIEFNNSFFEILSKQLNEKYQLNYSKQQQEFNAQNSGGQVQIEFITEEKEARVEQHLQRIHETILQLQADGFQLKDIAVLARKNSEGSSIAAFLSEKGIAVLSSESLLIRTSSEVNFVFSLLKYLSDSSDLILQAEIIEYLVEKKYIHTETLDDALKENKKYGLAAILKKAGISFNIAYLSKLALYELCEELILIFNLNTAPDAALQFFLDIVQEYTIKKSNHLNEFIIYWEDKSRTASLAIPEGINAVAIMTIHRSKGLEFPAVILPFMDSKIEMVKDYLWIDVHNKNIPDLLSAIIPVNKDIQETSYADLFEEEKNKSLLDNMNVLYVALTRAEERIYVFTGKPLTESSKEGFSTMTAMFVHYLKVSGTWSETQLIYSYGDAVVHQESKKKPIADIFLLNHFYSNQWREQIKMRAAAPGIWNTHIAELKKDYGVMMHTALSKIHSKDDVATALDAMLQEGLINTTEQEKLRATILKIISLPQLAPYFLNTVISKNEAEIITEEGELFRPDRVVIAGNEATVIEYKTGEIRPSHRKQILEYALLLQKMNYTVKEKLLVYIEKEEVIAID